MRLFNEVTGEQIESSAVREKMKATVESGGRLILGCNKLPLIGSVISFAELPFRVVRYCTREEAKRDSASRGTSPSNVAQFFFEVEVAD